MRKKKILIIAASITALCLFALITLLLLIDVNAYRPRVEAAASDALGMDVMIGGRMGFVLFPRFGISLEDVLVENRGTDLLSLEKVRVGLKIIPLLRRKVQISEFGLIKPKFTIQRDKKGKFNFVKSGQKSAKGEGRLPSDLMVGKFFISEGELVYSDKKSGKRTELKEFDLTIRNLSLSGERGQDPLRNIAFEGNFTCKELKTNLLRVSDLMFAIRGRDGIFSIDPLTMEIFSGKGKGKITLNMTGGAPLFRIHYTVSRFCFDEFLDAFSQKEIMKGETDLSMNLSMTGKSPDEIRKTISGEVSLSGENLSLYNLDLDRLLEKYRESQSFDIVDVGAFFFAGPLGTALTKGYDFAGLYKGSAGGKGTIRRLVSIWKIKRGIAEAEDVAFTTKHNRIALKGRLDFVNERFDDVTVAVLDERGCATFSQKIRGPFRNPRIEETSVLKSITGPVLKLLEKTKELVTKGECKVFYEGSVKHPN